MKLGVRILQNNFHYSLNFIRDKVSNKHGLIFTGEDDLKLQEMSIQSLSHGSLYGNSL